MTNDIFTTFFYGGRLKEISDAAFILEMKAYRMYNGEYHFTYNDYLEAKALRNELFILAKPKNGGWTPVHSEHVKQLTIIIRECQ